MLPRDGAVLGVDVGFSPTRRSSAVCRLEWTDMSIRWQMARFRAVPAEMEKTILQVAGTAHLVAAAFDGPLARGFQVIGRYRAAEALLTVAGLRQRIGKPGQSSSPSGRSLNHHANLYVGIVRDHCELNDAHHRVAIDAKAIAEAFPTAFLGLMLSDPAAVTAVRNNRSDLFYQALVTDGTLKRLIEHHLPGRQLTQALDAVVNHDDRAALVCALTALGVGANSYTAVGDHDGWIILPPRELLAGWALPILDGLTGGFVAEGAGLRTSDGILSKY